MAIQEMSRRQKGRQTMFVHNHSIGFIARVALIAAILMIPSASFAFSPGGGGQAAFEFEVGGGWGKYDMSSLNDDYIEKVGRQLDVFSDGIQGGPGFSAGAGYFVLPDLAFGLGLTWLAGSADHDGKHVIDTIEGPVVLDIDSEMKASMIAVELRLKYYLPAAPPCRRVRVFLGGSFALCYGTISLDVDYAGYDSDSYDFSAWGPGFSLSAGLKAEIAGPFSIFAGTGYRHYGTRTLKDGAGEEWILDILEDKPPIDLDFSGWFAMGGFSLCLWK